MTKTEAKRVLDKLQSLYPQWSPTDDQLAVWRGIAESVSTLAVGLRAADLMYRSSQGYVSPSPAGYHDALARAVAGGQGSSNRPPGLSTVGYCLCATNDRFPHRVGWILPVVLRDSYEQPLPQGQALVDVMMRHAGRLQELYGGSWEVLEGWTMEQAMARRRDRRAEAGHDDTLSPQLGGVFDRALSKLA